MDPAIPPSLQDAYHRCEGLVFRHYENFPVASLLLSRTLRPHVAALYAFARTADDFADEDAFAGRRLREIAGWERGLRRALAGKTAHPSLMAFSHTMKTFEIPLALPLRLLKAFRLDASFKQPRDWKALLHYCRHSADPVGRMVLLIHGIREEPLLHLSDRICTGLQLINFWQDTAQDLARRRIYYPRNEVRGSGLRERDLLRGKDSPAFRALIREAVGATEGHFRSGFPLAGRLSGRLRLEIRATCLGGLSVLGKIRAADYNVLSRRPKLSARDKASIGLKALLGFPF